MANVEQVIESTVLKATKALEEQLDSQIEQLERLDDDDIEKLRHKRLQQMKKASAQKQEWISNGHGKYEELPGEKEFFDACKKSPKLVCHFYRESTMRCKIVDKHLQLLAPKHVETRFIKLDVERAPFLCDRLKIRVLPTIAVVINSITKDYIRGFDDMGGTDDFSTDMMEWRLACSDAIDYSGNILEPPTSGKRDGNMIKRAHKTIRDTTLSSDSEDD